ncbi:MAG TPA: iron-containing redox enzyme family protein [Actinomycetota bacterium]|nr:iron-containing redox enzyme family protein [Actinomycetota bacterium]
MAEKTLRQELDEATSDKRLLEHPFYKAWAEGTLTRSDLSFYAGQYWRQVESFPGYLDSLAGRMPDGAPRTTIESNLADERDDDHPGLWKDFAAELGRDERALTVGEIEPETAACVESFAEATGTASLPFALGMLYAYESQTPEVADTKVKGLREHYGIDGQPVRYFELHGELDVEHSAELAGALEAVIDGDDDLASARAGARAGAEAIWGLLDGVARVRGIG